MNEWSQYELADNTWVVQWANYLTQMVKFEQEQTREQAIQIIYHLFAAIEQGHSGLKLPQEQIECLKPLLSQSAHVAPFVYQYGILYLYRYFALEQRLAKQVKRLSAQQPTCCELLPLYNDLLHDPYQKQALSCVSQHALSLITGGPGTGKTYTLARIIAVLNKTIPNLRIAMAAPTGKAAQRMQEALQGAFLDDQLVSLDLVTPTLKMIQPITLHRLLGIGKKGRAAYHLKQRLPYDVVVVDEASMLDLQLATQLFEAIDDHTRLILLGDANQLTSVDVGYVLADLQMVPALKSHHVTLQHSRRFTADAQIGKFAKYIQSDESKNQDFEHVVVQANIIQPIHDFKQIQPDLVQLEYLPTHGLNADDKYHCLNRLWYGFEQYALAIQTYCDHHFEHKFIQKIIQSFDDYRILTAMNYGDFGVQQLNQYMEQQLLKSLPLNQVKQGNWYIGRPIIVTENNYQLGLSNGDIGICLQHRENNTQFEVFFPSLNTWVLATRLPQSIQTAFAMTIHKSQGSEFTHTAVVLEQVAEKLMSQELLYTAITRAKKVVTLLADQDTLNQALIKKSARQSGLLSHF